MSLFITLWSLVLWLSFLFWKKSDSYPDQIIANQLDQLSLPQTKAISLFEKISQFPGFNPGWFIRKITPTQKVTRILKLVQSPLSFDHFLVLKQTIYLGFMIFFWCYLWFGDLSWRNSFWLLFMSGLALTLPHLWLQIQQERYLKALKAEVPYFIDLLALTLQTGLNIEQALHYVANNKQGLISKIIAQSLKELKLGNSLETVLKTLKTDVPNPEFQHFIVSLLRAKKLGISLANTLEIQSKLIQTKRQQRAEELSRTAAVKISLPLVLFIFPALLIIYIGPGLLNLMQQT